MGAAASSGVLLEGVAAGCAGGVAVGVEGAGLGFREVGADGVFAADADGDGGVSVEVSDLVFEGGGASPVGEEFGDDAAVFVAEGCDGASEVCEGGAGGEEGGVVDHAGIVMGVSATVRGVGGGFG